VRGVVSERRGGSISAGAPVALRARVRLTRGSLDSGSRYVATDPGIGYRFVQYIPGPPARGIRHKHARSLRRAIDSSRGLHSRWSIFLGVDTLALILGLPGDVIAVVLGIVMFAVLFLLLEGIDRV
jgi:hypothetical protein